MPDAGIRRAPPTAPAPADPLARVAPIVPNMPMAPITPIIPLAPASPGLTPLSDLPAGGAGRLRDRDLAEGEACLLAAMGLTEGCRLVVRACGDPCIVEVRSTRIALARSVASRLLVSREPR